MKPAKRNDYGSIRPTPVTPSATRDVMAGPVSTFIPLDPKNNTPRSMLMRPGKLGLGTRMG